MSSFPQWMAAVAQAFMSPLPFVLLPRCLLRDYPGHGGCVIGVGGWVGGGGGCRWLGSHPPVFPLGGADACTARQGVTLLHGPSICTRSVQRDLRRSQVLRPFPTPGSGTLWIAREPLRDRRISCLPRWTVCPTHSPRLGANRSTCCGECSLSGPLVTPPGRCHLGPLTNGPGRIPPYCVCSGGADTGTWGGPKPLRLGPSPVSPVGTFRPVPRLPLCWPPPFRSLPSFSPFPRLPACSWAPSVPCLSLALSLCPSPHRHNARKFQGRFWVGVARAYVSPALHVARHLARPLASSLFASVPPPPRPALSLVTVPLPPSSSSRQPPRRARGVVFVLFFRGGGWWGGGGGAGGLSCSSFPRGMHVAGTVQARCVAHVCGGGGEVLRPLLGPFPLGCPACRGSPGALVGLPAAPFHPALPHVFCGGGLLFGSLRRTLVPSVPAAGCKHDARTMQAQTSHNNHIFSGCTNGFLSTWQ